MGRSNEIPEPVSIPDTVPAAGLGDRRPGPGILYPLEEDDRPAVELLIQCGSCGAEPGFYCVTKTGRRSHTPHRARRQAVPLAGALIFALALDESRRRRVSVVAGETLELLLGAGSLEHPADRAAREVHGEPAHNHSDERRDERDDPALPAGRKLELG